MEPIKKINNGMHNIETEDEDEIYDSIYMQVVELVEKDNISCGFYKDTANKLKDLYVITKRSETPNQERNTLQEEVERLRTALEKIIEMNRQQAKDQYGDENKAENLGCVRVAREALKPKVTIPELS